MEVNKIGFNLFWAIILFITGILYGCVDQSPAKFEVLGLNIAPNEVEAGQNVVITATIKNMSNKDGNYKAILKVNDWETENKTLSIIGNGSSDITFNLSENAPGDYQVTVENMSANLRVKEKKPSFTLKQVELKWDSENPYKYLVSVDGGYLVKFEPPTTPFTINKVTLFGARGSVSRKFDIEILDENHNILYKVTLPDTKFPMGEYTPGNESMREGGKWVAIDIPDVAVSNTFYIHMWNGPKYGGIHMGADANAINEHSSITTRYDDKIQIIEEWGMANLCLCWSFEKCDQSKVNWMIRTAGTYPEPIK
jgi:hypothetical protein